MTPLAMRLLTLLEQGPASIAKAAKKLGIAQSQLYQELSWLHDSTTLPGLDLIEAREDQGRERLQLTSTGKRLAAALPGSTAVRALRLSQSDHSTGTELVAEEEAVALIYNGILHAVMMATPRDLEDFALGFSLSEGIIEHERELLDCEIVPQVSGTALELRIPEQRFHQLKERRRNLTGRTGCGLCGTESLEQAIALPSRVGDTLRVSSEAIRQGLAELEQAQMLNQATGAVHAAAWWARDELRIREDIGRHNALDKLIGAQARAPLPPGPVLITSRASYEMVAKAANAGVQILAAISAPTALAIDIADIAGMTLIGFARDGRMTVFTHPERISR